MSAEEQKTFAAVANEAQSRSNSVGHVYWKQKGGRVISRTVYTTSEYPQMKIRNAISGNQMPGVVGNRADEQQYCKVKYAVGLPRIQAANHSNTLFFESHEEFWKYFGYPEPHETFE